jgi:hypothetical protein
MNTQLIGQSVLYELLDKTWLVGEVLEAEETTLTIHFKSYVEGRKQIPLRKSYKQDVNIKDLTIPEYE